MVLRVYEPPASRFARRVPLLLAQKGEVAVASRLPGSFGWTLCPLGSRLRGNDGCGAEMTEVRVYEPPASRFARRVPLLLAQKGEVAVIAQRSPTRVDERWAKHTLLENDGYDQLKNKTRHLQHPQSHDFRGGQP